jgi:hypothetical protein
MRVVTQKNAGGVFFLANQSLEIRDLGICAIEDLLGLKQIHCVRDAVLDAQCGQRDRIVLCRHCRLGNVKLKFQLQKREIVTRQVANELPRPIARTASTISGRRRPSSDDVVPLSDQLVR